MIIESPKITILYHDGETQVFETPNDVEPHVSRFYCPTLTHTFGFVVINNTYDGKQISIPTDNIKRITTEPIPAY